MAAEKDVRVLDFETPVNIIRLLSHLRPKKHLDLRNVKFVWVLSRRIDRL